MLTKKEFAEIYNKVPRVTIDLIILESNGVVFTKRSIEPWKGFWHLPGGTILMGESLEEAANRVSEDEVGVKVKLLKIYPVIEWLEQNHGFSAPGHKHCYSIPVVCKIVSGALRGSEQGEKVGIFNFIPDNLIKEHFNFFKIYWQEILESFKNA